MDLATLLSFAAASAAMLAIRGPTALRVGACAPSRGRRVAAAGVALGHLVAMALALAGLGAPMAASARALAATTRGGAASLVWTGVRLRRAGGAALVGMGAAPALARGA